MSDAVSEVTHEEQMHVPAAGELQLTVRAVLVGCVLGGVVSAMNIYFGLRTGFSIGGSLIAAILGFSIFAAAGALFGAKKSSVLETNITQTAGSAAGSMASAAGLLNSIPALAMLGVTLSYGELTLWALSIAYLGVFFAVPLRNQLVVVEKLRFPTGTATAETIVSMFAEGAAALAQARALLIAAIFAGGLTLAAHFFPIIHRPPLFAFAATAVAWSFSLYVSPLLTGAGFLIGPRVATSLLLGAIVSWGVLGPIALSEGWVDGPIMDYKTGPRGWILWPGVAIMIADALTNLGLSWRTIANTFKRGAASEALGMEAPEDQIPNAWWMGGLLVGASATVTVAWFVFEIPPWMTVIAIAMSSVLAAIAVRSVGETDINPTGGMGKVTQLVFGGVGQTTDAGATALMTTNLMTAGVTAAGASQSGDLMQDLKTGRLLGASPRKQIIAQLFGIAAGVLVAVPIFKLFQAAGEADPEAAIGSENVPAPAAQAWRAMAEVLSTGFENLPTHALWAILGGLFVGAFLPIFRRLAPEGVRTWIPSGLAFGIAFIIPAYYSVAMFLGAVILMVWKAASPTSAKLLAIAVASGLIAGEGLMGVVNAVLTVLGIG